MLRSRRRFDLNHTSHILLFFLSRRVFWETFLKETLANFGMLLFKEGGLGKRIAVFE